MKPSEIFFAIRDQEERPTDPLRLLEYRDKLYDENLLQIKKKQLQDLQTHNKRREEEPVFENEQQIFNRAPGVRDKVSPRYLPIRVAEDNLKTVIDDSNRKIHKENIKRT